MEVLKCWKTVEFLKNSIKIKNCKIFCEAQTATHLKEIIQPPPKPHPLDKILPRLWNKKSLMEIYRIIQTFAFKMLQECSSWASRNGVVQMFFLTPNRSVFAGKFLKSERLLAVLRKHIFSTSSELRFVKWVRFFEGNCIVKWAIFFASFCWLWDFLLENLILKKDSDDVHWNMWTNIKKLYASNNIFKKIPSMRFWTIYILIQILLFGGLL